MPNILELAKILDLPFTKTSSKADIFKLITHYVELVITNDYFPFNTQLKDTELLLWKSIHQISRGRATINAGGYNFNATLDILCIDAILPTRAVRTTSN